MQVTVRASVLVVTYNSISYVDSCFDTLVSTLPSDCEIIVVDNASSDGSPQEIARRFPSIRLVANANNLGFAPAMNQAARMARGNFVVPLNPDIRVSEGWLDSLIAPFLRPPGSGRPIGATTPRILMLQDPTRINACGNTVHISGLTTCRGLRERYDEAAYQDERNVPACSGACFAMPTTLWNELGGFDERFFMYLEDTDLSIRLTLLGYAITYVPQSILYHDYMDRFSPTKLFYLERNRLLMMRKNMHPAVLAALFPAFAVVEIMSWVYCISRGPSAVRAKLQALLAALADKQPRTSTGGSGDQFTAVERMTARLETSQVAGAALGKSVAVATLPIFAASRALALVISRVLSTPKEQR